jgi:hypothetical protein
VEFSDDMFLITRDAAEAYLKARETSAPPASLGAPVAPAPAPAPPSSTEGGDDFVLTPPAVAPAPKRIRWSGEVSSQKWMNFYTKVLARFATGTDLRLSVQLEVDQQEGISKQKIDETKVALRELGLKDDLKIE